MKEKIERHTHQVLDNILKINQSSNEWEFANKLTTKICDVSKQSAYSAFQRWLLLWPAIQLWLSNDAAAVSSIYSIAHLEGITSEIMAHLATKKNLEVNQSTLFNYYHTNSGMGISSEICRVGSCVHFVRAEGTCGQGRGGPEDKSDAI